MMSWCSWRPWIMRLSTVPHKCSWSPSSFHPKRQPFPSDVLFRCVQGCCRNCGAESGFFPFLLFWECQIRLFSLPDANGVPCSEHLLGEWQIVILLQLNLAPKLPVYHMVNTFCPDWSNFEIPHVLRKSAGFGKNCRRYWIRLEKLYQRLKFHPDR